MVSEYQVELYKRHAQQQLTAARKNNDRLAELEMLFILALCYDRLGAYDDAHIAFQELLPLARTLQDKQKEKIALLGSAGALSHLHRYHDAIPIWQEALQVSRDPADQEAEAESLANLGFAYMQADLPDQALPVLQEALTLIRASGNRNALANTLNNIGITLAKLGRVRDAMDTYEQALAIARELGNKGDQAFQLGNIGHEYVDHLGQPERAIQYFTQALALFRDLADREHEAQTLYNVGKAYVQAEQFDQAQRALKKTRNLATALDNDELLSRVLDLLSAVAATLGRADDAVGYYHQSRAVEDPEEALERHQEARRHAREQGDRRAEAYHLGEVATALGVLQRHAEALVANLETIPLYRALEDRHGEAICFINIGTICFFSSHRSVCLACWRRGLDLLSGERSAEEEIMHRKLEQVQLIWGKRAFQQAMNASEPLYQRLQTGELALDEFEALRVTSNEQKGNAH